MGTACRAGLRPRTMGGGLECWVKHEVGSRCGPYKPSERSCDMSRGDRNSYFRLVGEGWGGGQGIGGAGGGCVRLAGAGGVDFITGSDRVVWCTSNQNDL